MNRPILAPIIMAIFLAPTPAAESVRSLDEALVKHADFLELRVKISPKKDAMDLRAVLLYVPDLLIEPSVRWPNGNPVGANARISAQQSLALLKALDLHGFFKRSGTLHSNRTGLTNPPFNGLLHCAPTSDFNSIDPGYELTLTGLDEYWCANFSTKLDTFNEGRDLLRELIRSLRGQPAELLSALERQLG